MLHHFFFFFFLIMYVVLLYHVYLMAMNSSGCPPILLTVVLLLCLSMWRINSNRLKPGFHLFTCAKLDVNLYKKLFSLYTV